MKALKRLKIARAAEYDRISSEMLRVVEIYWRTCCTSCLINAGKAVGNLMTGAKPLLYPFTKEKARCRFAQITYSSSASLRNYMKIVIERVANETENKIWDVQAGFRKGMRCTDQDFFLRNITKKLCAKGLKVFCTFVDLEEAYDGAERNDLWNTLSVYGMTSGLIRAL
ncbi:hypothetical protein EVAR_29622_1 [Eumeta japonica]|uniref:Reverse transcriptase domain-containing protein n=1 Tax=Eumeta variegata TaxID=151549 RepID=A0A4C1VUG7_EUMVA|nr:hypothetical protein EVAR_29622_1 [Eumeta japonica]